MFFMRVVSYILALSIVLVLLFQEGNAFRNRQEGFYFSKPS